MWEKCIQRLQLGNDTTRPKLKVDRYLTYLYCLNYSVSALFIGFWNYVANTCNLSFQLYFEHCKFI